MPELITIMEQYDEISETDFDRLRIAKTADQLNKVTDNLVLNRRRSVLISHPRVIEREIAYKNQRDEKIVTRTNKKTIAILKTKTNFTLRLTNFKTK